MGFVVLDLSCRFGVSHLGRTSRGARPFQGVHEFVFHHKSKIILDS